MNKQNKSKTYPENGQAIILLALGAVVMLGFAALSIDGGMVYANQRHAQNAADSASLAGALGASRAMESNQIYYSNFDCSAITTVTNVAKNDAIARASSNDYTIDMDISDKNGVETTCVDDEDKGAYIDKYIDIHTVITRNTDTSLIHFVYNGPVVGTVEAITRVRPRTPLAFGNAIVALNEAGCSGNQNGVIAGGSSGTFVHGGGVFSNGCLKCNGSGDLMDVDPPYGIGYAGTTNCGSDNLDPDAAQVPSILPQSSVSVETPDCSGLPNRSMPNGKDVTLEPGVYTEINDNGKDTVTLNPGLYCVTGSPKAVKVTSGWFYGDGITIYALNGSVQFSGGGDDEGNPSVLNAPDADPDPSPAIPGLLIYLAEGNTQEVHLTGNSEAEFEGVVYVPEGDITATGTGDLGAPFNTQLIGQNVEIEGNAYIDINFDGGISYNISPKLDMQR